MLLSTRARALTSGTALLATGGLVAAGLAGAPSADAAATAVVTARPSASIVSTGARVAATGVAPASAKTVSLQVLSGARWKTVTSAAPRAGRYTLRVPTAAPGTNRYRVVAAAGRRALGTSAPFEMAVGAGSTRSVAYLTKPPMRWNPCRTISYRVNLAGAPRGAAADVKRAVAEVSRVTGLRFAYAGTTTVVPGAKSRSVPDRYPSGTSLVIAYTRPGRTTYLPKASNTLGVGGAFYSRAAITVKKRPAYQIVQGYLVLDSAKRLPGGFGASRGGQYAGTWGQVLMHELGHVVGLDHPRTGDRAQIMYPTTTTKVARWGAGDLVGLKALGAGAGCFPTAGKATTATGGRLGHFSPHLALRTGA